MRTRATARFVRVPASKARLVLDHIRGKSVGEALATLQYTPKAAARLIEKVLRSAIANAVHVADKNHKRRIDEDDLFVSAAFADQSIEVSVVNGKQQAAFSVGDSKCVLVNDAIQCTPVVLASN